MISDGDNNNMIMLAISKVKASDEAKYKLTIENCHGKDEAEFMLFVSGKSKGNLLILETLSPYTFASF